MSVDVLHVVGGHPGVPHRQRHRPRRAGARWIRRRDVVRVVAHAGAGEPGVGPSSPAGGMFGGLEHDHGSAFAEDESVPLLVERPGRRLRFIVAQ